MTRNLRLLTIVALLVTIVLTLSLSAVPTPHSRASAAGPSMQGLHVEGNRLVNGAGQVVRLLGVNRSGTEYACIQGWGFHDGPADTATARAIASWGANTVRVPLNETCWLGINGAPTAYSGAAYRDEIARWVGVLNAEGLVAVLELHWAAPGTQKAMGQTPMPNRDHTPEFWRQVATRFKGNSMVVFDLYNEPYPDSNSNTYEAWRCWRDGGTCRGISYQAAGMQELVNAVRSTGVTNVLMLGGVQYSNSLWRWVEFKPADSLDQLMAAWHIYDFNWYVTESEWDQMVSPVLQRVPVVAGEVGDHEGSPCTASFSDRVMDWLDARGGGYLAWTWNLWGSCTDLILDWSGTPTSPYGQNLKSHLAASVSSDTTAPRVGVPVQRLVGGVSARTVSVPVRVSWWATDGSGISRYRLQRSVDGGTFTEVTLPTPRSTSRTLWLAPGNAHRFRVKAVDQAGNWSGWKYGFRFRITAYQESNPAVRYTGTWTRQALSDAYGGYVKYTRATGARATLSFTGRGVAWVARPGPTRGKAEVWVDGARVATIDLYAPQVRARRVVYVRSWAAGGSHTVQVRALGTAGRPRVDVDALLVLRRVTLTTNRFVTLRPGSALPSGPLCADRVRRSIWEPRPENYTANHTKGISLGRIDGASDEGNSRLAGRINGYFIGTTDEIIQWGACKWGFDEDIVRAVGVQESWWRQSTLGDGGESFGLMQVKRTVHDGTYPAAEQSTAFNLDYALAWRRACYEGYFGHWIPSTARGDEWGCVGLWYSGRWRNDAALGYIADVRRHLDKRTWTQPGF